MNKTIPILYYVYEITKNEIPCYVGKGTGKRVLAHFKSYAKSDIAKQIQKNPSEYDYNILHETRDEKEAYDLERTCVINYFEQGIELVNVMHSTTHRKTRRKTLINALNKIDGMIVCYEWESTFKDLAHSLYAMIRNTLQIEKEMEWKGLDVSKISIGYSKLNNGLVKFKVI